MALYRIVSPVAKGDQIIPVGTVGKLEYFTPQSLAALLRKGAITEVSPPPLSIMPGWKLRSAKLAKIGIEDAVQLLEGDTDDLMRSLRMTRVGVQKWKKDAEDLLTVDPQKKG